MLILADDFTGACDAAAPFAAAGLGTYVGLGSTEAWPSNVEVLALDLDVRERSDAEARMAAEHAAKQPSTRLFLKIDSTLRGPIGGLVAGALAGSGLRLAVVAPAFPEQGRLLSEGRLRLRGHDGASLYQLLGVHEAAIVGASLSRDARDLEPAISEAAARSVYVIVDADAPECLASVAAVWQRHPEWLVVGSSGLSRRTAGPARASVVSNPDPGGAVIVVAGSPAEPTQRQITRLADLEQVRVLTAGPTDRRDAGQTAAEIAARLSEMPEPSGLVLAGGQTGRAVCDRLGVAGIRIEGELEPGVPFGRFVGGAWDGVRLVTKAGGFGGPDTLLDAVRALGVSSKQTS